MPSKVALSRAQLALLGGQRLLLIAQRFLLRAHSFDLVARLRDARVAVGLAARRRGARAQPGQPPTRLAHTRAQPTRHVTEASP